MTKDKLKILSLYIIQSSKLTNPAKVELLEYVVSANTYQLINFVLEGKIVSSKYSKQEMESLAKTFVKTKQYQVVQEIPLGLAWKGAKLGVKATGKAIGKGAWKAFDIFNGAPLARIINAKLGIVGKKGASAVVQRFLVDIGSFTVVSASLIAAWKVAALSYSASARRCPVLKSSIERKRCMLKTDIQFANKKLSLMNQSLADCQKQKNREACQQKVQQAISKTKFKIGYWTNQLRTQDEEAEQERQDFQEKQQEKLRNEFVDFTSANQILKLDIDDKTKIKIFKYYINEIAPDTEIMSFLLDKRFKERDYLSEQIIRDRFKASNLSEIGLKAAATGIGGMAAYLVAWSAVDSAFLRSWRMLKGTLNKDLEACGKFRQGLDFERCMMQARMKNQKDKLALLNKMKSSQCQKNKNPNKCIERMTKKIDKESEVLEKLNQRMQILK